MACYFPLEAFRTSSGDIVFCERARFDIVARIELPCGRCIGCRLSRAHGWAIRCVHEMSLHKRNCFITLTYDEENCPRNRSLNYDHFQRFMKRLRKHFSGKLIRFYMCGEYGENFDRPHFHACIFGVDFDDKCVIRNGRSKLYRSATLEKLWPYGFSSIGDLTFESAAYTARYIMKKVTGDAAEAHYRLLDLETGELIQRTPEFNRMSLKPGIGSQWMDKFMSDVYPHDYVVVRGKKVKPPKYYDRLYSREFPDEMEYIQYARELDMARRSWDNSAERLDVRRQVAEAQSRLSKRVLE